MRSGAAFVFARHAAYVLALGMATSAVVCAASEGASPPDKKTAYDRLIPALMTQWHIPGGAVAVARDGRLVFARGYGWADVERRRPVEPDSLFRIASISKPITAAAVLVLVERGKLKLDDRVLDILPLQPLEGKDLDPRWRTITLRQLLQHTAGFDRESSFDPMFRPEEIARECGVAAPPGPREIIRFMLGRPLDFDPGAKYAYSNFGYCLLGRVIEQATGVGYAKAVRDLVLRPAGIEAMQLGRTRPGDRAAGEVCYYPYPGEEPGGSVFPDAPPGKVPAPDGTFYLEALDAHGGWLASAEDLVRFATALDGSRPPALLKPETLALIESPSGHSVAAGESAYYGLGWLVRPGPQGANWWHTGSLPGTTTLLVRTHHGMVWAALFNSRPERSGEFSLKLDQTMWEAAREKDEGRVTRGEGLGIRAGPCRPGGPVARWPSGPVARWPV